MEAAKTGFTFEQLQVLIFLAAHPKTDINPAVLSREFFKEPHTITGLLNRLEAIGMVKRAAGYDTKHRNWVKVELTAQGKGEAKRAPEMMSMDGLLDTIFEDDDMEKIRRRCTEAFSQLTNRRYGIYARNVVTRRAKG